MGLSSRHESHLAVGVVNISGTRSSEKRSERSISTSAGSAFFITLRDGSEQKITRIAKQIGQWADDNSPLLGAPGPVWTKDGKGVILADYDPAKASGGGIFLYGLDGHRRPSPTPPVRIMISILACRPMESFWPMPGTQAMVWPNSLSRRCRRRPVRTNSPQIRGRFRD